MLMSVACPKQVQHGELNPGSRPSSQWFPQDQSFKWIKRAIKRRDEKGGKRREEDERGDNTAEHAKNIVPIQPM